MSASEKLKALDEALLIFGSGPDWIDLDGPKAGTAVVRLKRTLPQIVAVTLWAEQTIKNFEEYGEVSFIPLIDSLEELDKALS
jgi:hypothetical protein